MELYNFIIYCIDMVDLKRTVGNNIRFYRKRMGISQEQLAELINITAPSLSSLENGVTFPAYTTFLELIDKLNIRPYQLFISDDEELTIKAKELQVIIAEKFQNVSAEHRKIIFTIIDALANEKTHINPVSSKL